MSTSLRESFQFSLIKTGSVDITLYDLLLVVFVVLVTLVMMRIARKAVRRFISKNEQERRTYWAIFQIVKYFTWVLIIVFLMEIIGMKVTVFLASIAALLVGVGLGIQQLFNDITSGIVLLFENNLKINDVIQLDDGTVGKVLSINLRTSTIRTREDIIMVIPNSKFVNDKIINWSHMDFRTRFFVQVRVAYGSDVKLVNQLLLTCAKRHDKVADDPAPFVRLFDFGESALEFQLFFWVDETFIVENIKSEVRFFIEEAFRKNGIRIPFPQRDVHVNNLEIPRFSGES